MKIWETTVLACKMHVSQWLKNITCLSSLLTKTDLRPPLQHQLQEELEGKIGGEREKGIEKRVGEIPVQFLFREDCTCTQCVVAE